MLHRSFIGLFLVWDIAWCFLEYSGERDRLKRERIKSLSAGDTSKAPKDGPNRKIEFHEMAVGDEKNVETLMEEGSIRRTSTHETNSEREEHSCDQGSLVSEKTVAVDNHEMLGQGQMIEK
jgi:hypothetical protein